MRCAEPTTELPGVFADLELDRTLSEQSVALVPLLSPDEVAAVLEAYERVAPTDESGLLVDYLRVDRAMMRAVEEFVEPIWERYFPRVFPTRRPVASSFLVKRPGADSTFILHRDLPVIDERRHRNYTLWVPLVDVGPDIDNGGLELVHGTESLDHVPRGLDNMVLFDPYRSYLEDHLRPVEVPAGVGAVFDIRIVHGSPSNSTRVARPAFGCLLALQDEPPVQVLTAGRRRRRVFAVDKDFFIEHHPLEIKAKGMPDRYPCIDEYEVHDPGLAPAELAAAIGSTEVPRPQPQIPEDVRGDRPAAEFTRLEPARSPAAACRSDVVVPWDLLDDPPVAPELGVAATAGRVGVLQLLHHPSGEVRRGPDWLDATVVPVAPRGGGTSALMVLDVDSRCSLELGVAAHMTVLECPRVRSGLIDGDDVLELDLGVTHDVPAGRLVQMWNDGPGPVVVHLHTSARRRPRLLRRLIRGR